MPILSDDRESQYVGLLAAIYSLSLGFILLDPKKTVLLTNPAVGNILGSQPVTIEEVARRLKGAFDVMAYRERCLREMGAIEVRGIPFGNTFLRILMTPILLTREFENVRGSVIMLIEDTTETEMLERAKDDFLSIASHELRTPLTAIRGNMSIIKEHFSEALENKDVAEMVEDSYQASIRLIKIVGDFLDVSGLEQRRISFQKERIELMPLINEVLRELESLAREKHLSLTAVAPNFPAVVLADRERTGQVIMNLVGNGLRYTEQGGVSVTLEKQDGFIEVLVSDTGRGIAPQNYPLLFRKFQQAGEGERVAVQGTGLGLYIAKLLVEGMGGAIGLVRSEVGKGSTFRFTLPVA